jgi:hypothetical protein
MGKLKEKSFALNSAVKLVKLLKKCMDGYKKQPENRAEAVQHNGDAFLL